MKNTFGVSKSSDLADLDYFSEFALFFKTDTKPDQGTEARGESALQRDNPCCSLVSRSNLSLLRFLKVLRNLKRNTKRNRNFKLLKSRDLGNPHYCSIAYIIVVSWFVSPFNIFP